MRYITYEADYLAKDWTHSKANAKYTVDIRWCKAAEDFVADICYLNILSAEQKETLIRSACIPEFRQDLTMQSNLVVLHMSFCKNMIKKQDCAAIDSQLKI